MNYKNFSNLVKQVTRKLRREQTESETVLWEVLRNRKLIGRKFLRQCPIVFEWEGKKRFFIADFYCHAAKLAVELDGAVHLRQKDYDKARDYVLKSMGIKVLHIKNEKVISNMKEVIANLEEELGKATCPLSPSLIKRGGIKGGEL